MNITELIVAISNETGVPRKDVAQVLESFVGITKKTTMSGERLMLRSFGVFYSVTLKSKELFGGQKQQARTIIRFKEARPWKSTTSSSTTRR